jgi:hypothetical protein
MMGGIAKGLPLDDGGFPVRGTIVKAKDFGDATRQTSSLRPFFELGIVPVVGWRMI